MPFHLSTPQTLDIAFIAYEVKKHGFYSSHCANVIPVARSQKALIKAIKVMASNANLKVSFNAQQTLCVFEAA